MRNVLVLYDSRTGNTRRMAEHVAAGAAEIPGIEARLRFVEDATAEDIRWCDGIAVGSPTHMGIVSWRMKKFWDDLGDELWGKIDGRIGCAFSSSGGWGGGNEVTCLSIHAILMNFGFLVFGLPDYNPRIRQIDGRLFPFGFWRLLRNKREIKRMPKGRAVVIPLSDETRGHGSHTVAKLWKQYLQQLLQETLKPRSILLMLFSELLARLRLPRVR